MKKTLILIGWLIGFLLAANAAAQTPVPIRFAKGTSEKTLTVTLKPNASGRYSIFVRKNQVINLGIEGDINVSKTTEFPVISINLDNGTEDLDRWQDGEGYLSILTGKTGNYIISLANSDKKRARTFTLKVKVTDNPEDFLGGEEVDQ